MSEPKRPPYRPGWTNRPRAGDQAAPLEPADRGDQRLARGLAADRAAAVLVQAENCTDCLALRRESADPGALCDEHLGQALGVTGGWAFGAPGRKIR